MCSLRLVYVTLLYLHVLGQVRLNRIKLCGGSNDDDDGVAGSDSNVCLMRWPGDKSRCVCERAPALSSITSHQSLHQGV